MFGVGRTFNFTVIGVFSLFMSFWSVADTKVTVTDNAGQPVVNAVVSVKVSNIKPIESGIAIMDQIDFSFVPRVLVIQKGQSVSFPNSDDIRHSVYSFSEAKAFELKLYRGNQTEPLLFNKPGLVVLGCNIHDDMIGYIYVTDNEIAHITDEEGSVVLPLDNINGVSIWHERLIQGVSGLASYEIDPSKRLVNVALDLIPEEKDVENRSHEGHTSHLGFGKKF